MVKPITVAAFLALPEVRISSTCGPCLPGFRLVRTNRETSTVASMNGTEPMIERTKGRVHTVPCSRCADHVRTAYPDGYMD